MANTRVTNPVTGFNSATEEGLKLPSGTNANQPSGVQGMIRNDTEEIVDNSASALDALQRNCLAVFCSYRVT